MSYVDFMIRVFNLTGAMVFIIVLLWAGANRWSSQTPQERLFVLGLLLYGVYGATSTIKALIGRDPVSFITIILTVANIWLVVAIIGLMKRERERHQKR